MNNLWQPIQIAFLALSNTVVTFAYSYSDTILSVSYIILAMGIVQNIIYLLQLPIAYYEFRKRKVVDEGVRSWSTFTSNIAIPISLLVPAYNEEATIVENVRSVLTLHYPSFEVIVINDGSKDRLMEVLIEAFELHAIERVFQNAVPHRPIRQIYGSPSYPNLLVIDKENGGKSDALNAGINFARCPLFCAVDADSLLEADSLLRVVQPFIEDTEMVAVGGTIRVANGCTVKSGCVVEVGLPHAALPLFQTMEYIRAFLVARLAWSSIGVLTVISGAFGVFKREVAIKVGGYSMDIVGEDVEIILKMHRYLSDNNIKYAMRFVPEPVCWTEAPETLAILARQRMRWQRGALESFFKHRDMLFNPRYGRIGVIGFAHTLIVDVLGPPVEILGYILIPLFMILHMLSTEFILAYTALVFVLGVFISVCSLIMEELELKRFPRPYDLAILTAVAVIENFGYRQLNNIWRVVGYWQYLQKKEGWGTMTRKGFKTNP